MTKKGIFIWYPPESQYDYGTVSCPTRFRGCGQRHEFELWTDGEIKTWIDTL